MALALCSENNVITHFGSFAWLFDYADSAVYVFWSEYYCRVLPIFVTGKRVIIDEVFSSRCHVRLNTAQPNCLSGTLRNDGSFASRRYFATQPSRKFDALKILNETAGSSSSAYYPSHLRWKSNHRHQASLAAARGPNQPYS